MNPECDEKMLALLCEELVHHGARIRETCSSGTVEMAAIVESAHAIEAGASLCSSSEISQIAEEIESIATATKTLDAERRDALLWAAQRLEEMGKAGPSCWKTDQLMDVQERLATLIGQKAAPPPPSKECFVDTDILNLFFCDLEKQTGELADGLLRLESETENIEMLDRVMRAAHSIKGAARVLDCKPIVEVAHALEDLFSAAKKKECEITSAHIDLSLKIIDLFESLQRAGVADMESWLAANCEQLQRITEATRGSLQGEALGGGDFSPIHSAAVGGKDRGVSGDLVRLSASELSRLMGLSGELLVDSRWLHPFAEGLLQIKRCQNELSTLFDRLRTVLDERMLEEENQGVLVSIQEKIYQERGLLVDRLHDLEDYIRRHSALSDRLYREVIASRMCPFLEGISGLPRMVRDVAKELGKSVVLEVEGKNTPVDRDILARLQSPLNHLLRNSIDHGIEAPEERKALGKPVQGVIRLSAAHRGGALVISAHDDGKGVDIAALRKRILDRNLVKEGVAEHLTERELLEFLFLPGYSSVDKVSEISGRGVGLNVVQNMLHDVSGSIQIENHLGQGISFHMHLPLTLSVLRALLVNIDREAYAFPLARIVRTAVIRAKEIQLIENRQYFTLNEEHIGLVFAREVLELGSAPSGIETLAVVVLQDSSSNNYGIVVDELLGEHELVLQDIEEQVGKVPDISAGALSESGDPVLVIDVEDLIESTDKYLQGGTRRVKERGTNAEEEAALPPRILVVDDSVTVREVQSRLLKASGYRVDLAVNGQDGWNSLRVGTYDLVITDIDMPRLNGIELVRQIRREESTRNIPVLIVSYKESEEERKKGLDAGADAYLIKGSFQDDRFLAKVEELLGARRNRK